MIGIPLHIKIRGSEQRYMRYYEVVCCASQSKFNMAEYL